LSSRGTGELPQYDLQLEFYESRAHGFNKIRETGFLFRVEISTGRYNIGEGIEFCKFPVMFPFGWRSRTGKSAARHRSWEGVYGSWDVLPAGVGHVILRLGHSAGAAHRRSQGDRGPVPGVTLEMGMKRFAGKPSYAFPWHGDTVPVR
jgi:hypothetical protein